MKIAVVSDIHGNLEAFNAVLREIKKRKIKKILCCGDISDYGADSNKIIGYIRKKRIPSIKGNHDQNIATLERVEWFLPINQDTIEITNKQINEKNKKFLINLPETLKFENIFLVHGSPSDHLYGYIYPDADDTVLKSFLKKTGKGIIIMGHTHYPMIKKFNKKMIINPGSVGQPRDGNNKASFCILDNKKLEAEIVRVGYNIRKTAGKIIKAGIQKFHAERLYEGI